MYYLSLIGKELSATSEEEESRVLAAHPRYSALCELYGEPTITRAVVADGSGTRVIHPRSVAARLVKMAFRLSGPSLSTETSDNQLDPGKTNESKGRVRVKEIPSSFNSYQVKALVSRLLELPAYGFKLIWETDEWDPVEKEAGGDGVADWDEDSEDEIREPTHNSSAADASRFVRREVELVDSTRDIGFLFQGERGEVKIRVEVFSV